MVRPCTEVQEHLAAYVDNQTDDAAHAMVAAHIDECPRCRLDVDEQVSLKGQLQSLARREAKSYPAHRIWANAAREWDRRDGIRLRRNQARFAFAVACMLLMLFGAVWARLTAVHDFPAEAVLRDFKNVRSKHVMPAYRTADADVAARYLRDQLHVNLPPLNLALSRSRLLGADVIPAGAFTCGRLLYLTQRGLVGIYIVPNGTLFNRLNSGNVEGITLAVENTSKDIGLYGWRVGRIGYGLVAVKPLDAVHSEVLDAERNTRLPGQ